MPTGYTAAVVDGTITDLKTFALQCARGMGALIMMRDAPWDAPIPERFEPSEYHSKKIAEERAERDRLYALTDEQAAEAARLEYEEGCRARDAWFEEKRVGRERYNAMIAQVEAWQCAPEGLKEFMLEQLMEGRDFDCPEGDRYYCDPVLLSGQEWRSDKIEWVQKSILYHTEEDAKERARTESRNAWIAQLRRSLEMMEAA